MSEGAFYTPNSHNKIFLLFVLLLKRNTENQYSFFYPKIFLKKFAQMLDKSILVCYNDGEE